MCKFEEEKENNRSRAVAITMFASLIVTMIAVFFAAERLGYFMWLREKSPVISFVGIVFLVLIYIVVSMIPVAVIFILAILFDKQEGREFVEEYNQIVEEFRRTGDLELAYTKMNSMKNEPVTDAQKDLLFFERRKAYYMLEERKHD